MTLANDHTKISRWWLSRAEEELERGNLARASGQAWMAVSHRLTAIEERRYWGYNADRNHNDTIARLRDEAKRPKDLTGMFASADALRGNYYNDLYPEGLVRSGVKSVKRLLDLLDEIEQSSGVG